MTMKLIQWMAMWIIGLSLAEGEPRHRRGLLNLFSDNHQPVYHTGDASPVIIGDTDGATKLAASQNWMNTLHQQTNRLIEGAGDVVMTPVNILSHIKEYW